MKGDFSRLTFDARKHFSRVLQQQGRVQLDADWNEQSAILLHYLQTLAGDLIGEHGGPKDRLDADGNIKQKNLGFDIITDASQLDKFNELSASDKDALKKILTDVSADSSPLIIGKGRYYVDGLLAETESFCALYSQKDYPLAKGGKLKPGDHLVYLDLWERHITSLEDTSIREVALEGADTATRAKLVWQVKTKPSTAINNEDVSWDKMGKTLVPYNRGWLDVRAKYASGNSNEPCIISPDASYRGLENQLYRVEIHQIKDDGSVTFKCSRDNASLVTAVKLQGTSLVVDNPRGFSAGEWLELTSNEQELRGIAGDLLKIKKIEGKEITLDQTSISIPADIPEHETWPTKVRRWDSAAMEIQESSSQWLLLADGINIQFQPPKQQSDGADVNHYFPGDYWLIPARTATGDVEWPKDTALPPQGIIHHYAPLAIITVSASFKASLKVDLRKAFDTLATPLS